MNWIIVPILVPVTGFLVWYVQSRIEAIRSEREKFQGERRKVYLKILEPYIELLGGSNYTEVVKKMTTLEYRKIFFELKLMGSDDVNIALNKMLKHYSDKNNKDPKEYKRDMEIIGELFLAIRKDLGNRKTTLQPIDMLRGQITDIDKYI